ncbi:MAG: hypothetical protein QM808_13810 [Steroidobacteraceae bacterium]
MSKMLKVCVAAALVVSAMSIASAEDKYSEKETHVARGLSERMNTMSRWSKLAMEKGSTDLIRTFAKRDIEEHEKMSAELTALSKSLGIAGVGGGGAPGGAPPSGGQGAPQGAAPQGAGPQGAGGPPAGAAPGGAPGGAPNGAAGMGAGGGGGGPSSYGNRYYTQLQGLSGEAFDEMYMLRVLQYHEDMERTLNEEIRGGFRRNLMAWSKSES